MSPCLRCGKGHELVKSIKTAKGLLLRPASATDATFAGRLLKDPAVRQFLGGPLPDESLSVASRNAVLPDEGERIWIVESTGFSPLGLISLTRHKNGEDIELSYQFAPDHWGKGFAFDAGRTALAYGFQQLALPRIIAETQAANRRSIRLLTRLGLRPYAEVMRFGAAQVLFQIRPDAIA
ncbi:GNAT family N-acetyltransferase [Gymnodinialimonas sp. 2305UL16-5]|uniref:GNAT family N-acetyltransferase n=1 Tax=Gymnodinialimonas mytili TaxID=3126503 RepID=UPI0030A36AD2